MTWRPLFDITSETLDSAQILSWLDVEDCVVAILGSDHLPTNELQINSAWALRPLVRKVISFYKNVDLDGMPLRSIAKEILGIDFHRPVLADLCLSAGTRLLQYSRYESILGSARREDGTWATKDYDAPAGSSSGLKVPRIGRFFTLPGTPSQRLGIWDRGRSPVQVRLLQDIEVLGTTASGAVDSWSDTPNLSSLNRAALHMVGGGGIQYRIKLSRCAIKRLITPVKWPWGA